MKKTLLGLMTLLLPLTINAQLISVQPGTGRTETKKEAKKESKKESKKVEASVEADIVSHYIWRGQDLAGFSIQPSASVSWRGLSLTAEGSASLDKDDYQEIDLTLGYQLGPVNIGVSDYWCTGIDSENRYLYYDKLNGGHKFEGNLGFSCKYFSLQGYCMFWGNDWKIQKNSGDALKRGYSTYIELGVPFRLGNLDWQLTVGGTPMESGGTWEVIEREHPEYGLRETTTRVYEYAEGPACCLASLRCTKSLDLGKLSIPVFAEINTNPYLSKGTFLFGLSIKPW